jgi:hypothetical protein
MLLSAAFDSFSQWYIPANYTNTDKPEEIKLTQIGGFGLLRKARPNVPAHIIQESTSEDRALIISMSLFSLPVMVK